MGADNYLKFVSTIRLDLLDLFGAEYIFDHCKNEMGKRTEDITFKSYIADGMMMLVKMVKMEYKFRWIDIVNPVGETEKSVEVEDNRPCVEIAGDIWKRMRKGRH